MNVENPEGGSSPPRHSSMRASPPGVPLETLAGPQPVHRVALGDAIARHGLYVADGPTFFVARHGIEAHDATALSRVP